MTAPHSKAAAFAIFFNQGEMCSAGSRLLVEESIKDKMLEKIAAVGKYMKPGDPLDPATKLGAIVDEIQMKRVLGYIDAGKSDGAKVAFGGSRVREETGGFFVEPTVFDGVTPSMRIAKEEIFGPVLATITFKTVDEAIRLGGTITGEHGIGLAKKGFLPKFAGDAQMRVMRELRRALDPNGILNPGKMFD